MADKINLTIGPMSAAFQRLGGQDNLIKDFHNS